MLTHHTTEIILESISDGVFTIDKDWRISSFNRAAEQITGVSRKQAIGQKCYEVFRANMCEANCPLRQTMISGKTIVNKTAFIINSLGNRIPISISTSLLKRKDGTIIGGVETFRDLSLEEALRQELEKRFDINDMVSRSTCMHKILDILPQVASSDSTVLIQGETGTGKELLAQNIHNMSDRRKKPFIAVNCAALPDPLLESEMFGYKAGAFTGAQKDKPGRFALAKGGTIFLDEIGDISASLQIRLLRVLQEKVFEPLGSIRPEKADVRILSATNKDLDQLVKDGIFRQDLFYRIHVIKLELPPLRSRKVDIPFLIDRFIHQFNKLQKKHIAGISQHTLEILMAHDYPGNIRELKNIIEHAFVLCQEGLIEPYHLPDEMNGKNILVVKQTGIHEQKQSLEIKAILDALARHHYHRLEAAKELGIHKSTFFRKIKSLGIDLSDYPQ